LVVDTVFALVSFLVGSIFSGFLFLNLSINIWDFEELYFIFVA